MAFTSFTVRNTVSSDGSALRRTKVIQDSSIPTGSGDEVSDSGLRADGYFIPVPQSFLQSTFEVNAYSRTEIELNWELGFTIAQTPGASPEPVELLIRASSYGEPVTAGDGEEVIRVTFSNYTLSHIDNNPLYIKEGNWVYYSMFVRFQDSAGDAYYTQVASLSVQIPRNFGSTEDLWKRIPSYYRELDTDYATNTAGYSYEQGPLYRYIELFGWELDKIRTTIFDTMRINDPEVIHSSAIDSLANQSGIDLTKNNLGTAKLRALLNNIGYLQRTKGTNESVEAYISALSGCGVYTDYTGVYNFNVHPMRTNLFTDPFFQQAATSPSTPDTNSIRRSWTNLSTGGRNHGWGVLAEFSTTPPSNMVISKDNKLTVTLPAMVGTVKLHVYSRGSFVYNKNLKELIYYYSAISSHAYEPRFFTTTQLGVLEGLTTPTSVSYFDTWNDSLIGFSSFQDNLTSGSRKIFATSPSPTALTSSTAVVPVYVFDITLSSGSTTTVTIEKPLVEYKNSSGQFFSGNEAMGGFIPTPNGSLGEGKYDYHWGQNGGSSPHTDFSYYTLDFHRVQKVVDNVIENSVIPVTLVKNTDYTINWDVLE